jgi:hypothetical protein
MSSLLKIIAIVLVVVVLAKGVNYFFNSNQTYRTNVVIKEPHSGKQTMIIPRNSLPNLENGYEATYSLWYYIENNMSSDKDVHLLHIGDATESIVSPGIYINPRKNQLKIRFSLFKNKQNIEKEHSIIINNIEINRWTHLAISVQSDIIEVYLNGLLEKTSIAPSIPMINEGDMYICKNRNLNGKLANMKIIPRVLVPNDIKAVYAQGPIYKWWKEIL